MSPEIFNALVFWLPAFLFSLSVHEAAHAWAALRGGDPTAYLGGQVSLSPWPHIRRSPLGMLVVPLLTAFTQGWTLGWATTPFDREWAARYPRRAAFMAAAGPAGNLAIALVALLLLRAGLAIGVFEPPAQATLDRLVDPVWRNVPLDACAFAATGLSVLLVLNAMLLVFNLLPLPPLDGATVITLALPEAFARRVRAVSSAPGMSFIGILAAWQCFPLLTRPVLALVAALVTPGRF